MITIYGKSNCKWCTKAKELADQYNLEYEYKNVEDPTYAFELYEKNDKVKTVPQIFWDGRYIGGYDMFSEEVENKIWSDHGNGQI